MNPDVQAAITLINSIFVANGVQAITGTNSNAVLNAMIAALYEITGNNEDLDTAAKNNLVAAINELKNQIDAIDAINKFTGGADPNVEPPNGGDFDTGDIYIQTTETGAIAYWIYTGIEPSIGWLNLTANLSSVLYTSQSLSLAQKKQALKNLGWIEIGGNLFEYKRNPNNNTVGFIAGDIAVNGFIDANTFGRLLVYVSGTPTNINSWNQVDVISL